MEARLHPACHAIGATVSADRKNSLPERQRHPALRNAYVVVKPNLGKWHLPSVGTLS
jgi:hypothetical protein